MQTQIKITNQNNSELSHDNSYAAFLEDLAGSESSHSYNPYTANPYGFIGKYQMGEGALIDAGYYTRNGDPTKKNDWTGKWTGKDGVTSKQDFLDNHQAQENAVRDYKITQWKSITKLHLTQYLGQEMPIISNHQVTGYVTITESGLLAGAHLVGVGGLKEFLVNGNDVKDAFGTHVSSYISEFAGYDTDFGNTRVINVDGNNAEIHYILPQDQHINTYHQFQNDILQSTVLFLKPQKVTISDQDGNQQICRVVDGNIQDQLAQICRIEGSQIDGIATIGTGSNTVSLIPQDASWLSNIADAVNGVGANVADFFNSLGHETKEFISELFGINDAGATAYNGNATILTNDTNIISCHPTYLDRYGHRLTESEAIITINDSNGNAYNLIRDDALVTLADNTIAPVSTLMEMQIQGTNALNNFISGSFSFLTNLLQDQTIVNGWNPPCNYYRAK